MVFTIFPTIVAPVHKNQSCVECTIYSRDISLIYVKVRFVYVEVRPKHNSTMVSDASPGTTDPKMNESFVHTAQMSSDRACAQDGYFEGPHPTIIDDDKRSDSGWFFVGFGVGGRLTRD